MQQSQSAKQEALHAIQQLPDSVDFDDIVYRLYVINKIHKGMKPSSWPPGQNPLKLHKV